jgi:hypothetical protein
MANPSATSGPQPSSDEQLQQLLGERIHRFTGQLVQVFGMKVQSGPFAGMLLPVKASWGGGYLAPKILGCYEAELHQALEKAIARKPDVVINVGCAEGFYAIGLARRLPKSKVYAFDISAEAQAACASAAAENGVAGHVTVNGLCDGNQLVELTRGARRALIVMDCEGAEKELLGEETVKQLAHCDVIVELHDFVDRSITPSLTERFAGTHKTATIREGARDPSAHGLLRTIGSFDRAILVCEFRPELMHWMTCWARRLNS